MKDLEEILGARLTPHEKPGSIPRWIHRRFGGRTVDKNWRKRLGVRLTRWTELQIHESKAPERCRGTVENTVEREQGRSINRMFFF